jgi:hypothetical protein
MDGQIEITSISFNPNKMEFLILFTSGDISEDKEHEILNLGQAQILMDISQEKGSLMAIKVLLPTPLGEEAMNAVKKSAEKSELKITLNKQQHSSFCVKRSYFYDVRMDFHTV